MSREFLPVTRAKWKREALVTDFVYISGDAYVDHPSFEQPLTRLLESRGYSVGIVPSLTGGKREHFRFWRAQAGLSGFCRKYGFYGEPLYRGEKAPKAGFLFSGRQMKSRLTGQ